MHDRVQICNELGCVALQKGDHKEARKHFRCMVREARKHGLGEQTGALNRLGTVCMKMRRLQEAEDCFRESLELTGQLHGLRNPHYATELSNLGFLFWQGHSDLGKARQFFEEAVQILESCMPFGPEFAPEQRAWFARAFENLAGVLEQQKEYDAAESLLRKALQVKQDARGDSFPGIFQTALQLQNLLNSQGRSVEAEEVLTKLLPGVKRFAETVNDNQLNGLLALMDGLQ